MQENYIDSFPKPLLDDLVTGKWLPIIGAGFSQNAILPSKKQMPLWNDLGKLVGKELGDNDSINPIDALSTYEHEFKRPKLIELLHKLLLIDEARPGDAHVSFCQMQFDLVCTTNFDFLLEKQYELTIRHCTPLIDEDQLSVNLNDTGVALLKLHGDLHHPTRLIATENDYDMFLYNYPLLATFVANLLITRTAVLIGYSLDDPDFRQLWQIVGERLGRSRRAAYVLSVGAKQSNIARFERRGIKVINFGSRKSEYGAVLSNVFKELHKYWQENVISASYIKEEQPLREFSLPSEVPTRLCFFAFPTSLSSFYRDNVFPIIKDFGFVPVTADDVVSPGDTVFSKIDAMIKRSQLFIVDISTQNTYIELQLALKNPDKTKILIISQKNQQLPMDIANFNTLIRPDIFSATPDIFLDKIRSWLNTAAENFKPTAISEPQRLFDSSEYRAAVITAITLLESSLRKALDKPSYSQKPISLRGMLELAKERGLLGNYDVKTILDWLKIRNEVVHGDRNVSRNIAEKIVNGVLTIVERIT